MTKPRRLPAIRVDVTPPPVAEVLPRMDIAVFVGFAEKGPTHKPVVIESVWEYAMVFGSDVQLAFDRQRNETVLAYLGTSVRAFFANGGQRCWVIRVARTQALEDEWSKVRTTEYPDSDIASANRFEISGVFALSDSEPYLSPAKAQASSVGSWSDNLSVQTALTATRFQLNNCKKSSETASRINFNTTASLQIGDLIEFEELVTIDLSKTKTRYYAIIDDEITPDVQGYKVGALFVSFEETFPISSNAPIWSKVPVNRLNFPVASPTHATVLTLDLRVLNNPQEKTYSLTGVGLTPKHKKAWWLYLTDDDYYKKSDKRIEPQEPFPLAVLNEDEDRDKQVLAWIPLGVSSLFGEALAPLTQTSNTLERDGLSRFDAELFLDPELATLSVDYLIQQADTIRYLASDTRELFGIHAALSIGTAGVFNEASLIAVPDAVHIGWQLNAPSATVTTTKPIEPVDIRLFSNCISSHVSPTPPPISTSNNDTCWLLKTANDDYKEELLRIHRAMLRLAAASGELFAVMGLPRHYRTADATRYVSQLRTVESNNTEALNRALSYGAVYHPWIVSASLPEPMSSTVSSKIQYIYPPDGIAMGVLASRATHRGTWIAPANELFKNVSALTPTIEPSDYQVLQDAQINIIRADARGFLTLSADTLALANEPEWCPINVRRLFILLRRLALRRGVRYVFEPNDDVLRRAVERGFTFLLTDLFRRGAFAGATPKESFNVITRKTVNSNADFEAGRFFVDLQVAPSLPLQFLTIRLSQSGEHLAVLEEV